MKKWILAATVVLCAGSGQAQSSGFGLGLIVGDPTGVSWKYWLASDRALDGALAWNLWNGPSFQIHADYLFHNHGLITVSEGSLPLYYGPGLRLRSWSGDQYWANGKWHDSDGGRLDLGVRFPVGLAYLFDGAPVDIFFEIVPSLGLIPSTYFDLDFGLGARYWFK